MEGILLRTAAGDVVHVPLTYRAAPLDGAEDYLLGHHRALGARHALGVRRDRRPGLARDARRDDPDRRHAARRSTSR